MPGTILVLDPVATSRIVTKVRLSQAFYHVEQASDIETAVDIATRVQPDLVLASMGQDDAILALPARLRAIEGLGTLPVVFMGEEHGGAFTLRALRAGADDYIARPFDEVQLLARVRNLIRIGDVARELDLRHDVSDVAGFGEAGAVFTPQTTCALISYSPEAAMAWRNALGPFHIGRLIIGSRADAVVQRPDGTPPDAFVISADLASKGEGLRLLSELRSASGTRNAAIIIAVEDEDTSCAALALDMGANDVITMPFAAEELALRLQKHLTHKHRADQLRDNVARGLRLASVDPLTGLYNRRYALPHLDRIALEAQANATPYAVMVLDMDRFKRINDQFGHFVGDQVLAHVAKTLRVNLRPEDLLGRLGGEEFIVALPGATPTQANAVATRLCEAVRTTPVTLSDGPANALFVSISIGLATSARGHHAAKEMMQEADLALYEAKAAGRNTISTHSFAA